MQIPKDINTEVKIFHAPCTLMLIWYKKKNKKNVWCKVDVWYDNENYVCDHYVWYDLSLYVLFPLSLPHVMIIISEVKKCGE